MIDRSEAEEHLRIIRSLMEKATIYRAISAEAALVGGVLAMLGSFAFGNWWPSSDSAFPATPPAEWAFFILWGIILLVAGGANLLFLYRSAMSRGEPFGSSGMKLAVGAILPSFVAAASLTWLVRDPIWMVCLPPMWATCYGLALLATKPFAPRSLAWLGWAFLIAGLLLLRHALIVAWGPFYGIPSGHDWLTWKAWNSLYASQAMMAGTFGLFHLVYAACTWPRKGAEPPQQP